MGTKKPQNMKIGSTMVPITIEVPAELLELEIPNGLTLDNYVKMEKDRLTGLYPFIKGGVAELGESLRDMYQISSQQAKMWETWRQLVGLIILARMEWAKKAAANGVIFAERRDYEVKDIKPPEDHRVNAIFPANS